YVSTDQGRTWQLYANATPDQGYFKQFTAEHDGLYWFAVRTMDREGRFYPPQIESLKPGLKVHVDTLPPNITLRTLPQREGNAGVEWDVQDETLDLNALRLEYRVQGSSGWWPVSVDAVAAGQRYWTPGTNGTIEARLSVRDKAENRAEKVAVVSGGN